MTQKKTRSRFQRNASQLMKIVLRTTTIRRLKLLLEEPKFVLQICHGISMTNGLRANSSLLVQLLLAELSLTVNLEGVKGKFILFTVFCLVFNISLKYKLYIKQIWFRSILNP